MQVEGMSIYDFVTKFFSFIIVTVVLVFIFYVLIDYVFMAMGHGKVLKNMNYTKWWLVWIPFGYVYALADCIKDIEPRFFGLKINVKLFKLLGYLQYLLILIPILGIPLFLICRIGYLGWCYSIIYSRLVGQKLKDMLVFGYLSSVLKIIPIVWFLVYEKGDKE